MTRARTAFGLVLLFALGCANGAHLDPVVRRSQLLAEFPPGTPRAEVDARFSTSDLSFVWGEAPFGPHLQAEASASEIRTGIAPHRIEMYLVPDRFFLSLCWVKFYYDAADALVDAEWQWSSD